VAAIIIPTKHRSAFLSKQLDYYAFKQLKHTVYIGDGSTDGEELERTQQAIKQRQAALKIVYTRFSPDQDCHDGMRHLNLISMVSEEYVCFCGDDDFQIAETIAITESFLKSHPDYSMAYGQCYLSVLNPQVSPRVSEVGLYPHRSFEEQTAKQRLLGLFKNYISIHFGLTRTKHYQEVFKAAVSMHDRALGSELIFGALTAVSGKIKLLPNMGVWRQEHPHRYLLDAGIHWIAKETFYKDCSVFRSLVTEALIRVEGCSRSEAEHATDQALNHYISRNFVTALTALSTESVENAADMPFGKPTAKLGLSNPSIQFRANVKQTLQRGYRKLKRAWLGDERLTAQALDTIVSRHPESKAVIDTIQS
jgi:glycosyltransferase domain-containing protein